MKFPSRAEVERIRKEYPVGTRIELVSMSDPYNPVSKGTRGTIVSVDDAGTLHTKWDNGRSLGVVVGVDEFTVLDTVIIVCYGEEQVWDSRKEAADYFLEGIAATEGSECERYTSIYVQLLSGEKYCTDDL